MYCTTLQRTVYFAPCNLPIYLSARSLSFTLWIHATLYPFYYIHFRTSLIGLLASAVLPARYHFASLSFTKISRNRYRLRRPLSGYSV